MMWYMKYDDVILWYMNISYHMELLGLPAKMLLLLRIFLTENVSLSN